MQSMVYRLNLGKIFRLKFFNEFLMLFCKSLSPPLPLPPSQYLCNHAFQSKASIGYAVKTSKVSYQEQLRNIIIEREDIF